MAKIFYYKLTVDAGAAPSAEEGMLSLAIREPRIRTNAQEGDVIFGFTASSLDRANRLIYIARIFKNLGDGGITNKRPTPIVETASTAGGAVPTNGKKARSTTVPTT